MRVPIAHHVWAGNRVDGTTVTEVVRDLVDRFDFRRVLFVGDRGMVSEDNLAALQAEGHGYLVGLRRRRNSQVDAWLQQVRTRKRATQTRVSSKQILENRNADRR